MPIYEYECKKCGSFEHRQSIHDRPLARCPHCRSKVRRLISATAFQLKGGGWYADGYAKKPSTNGSSSAGTGGGEKKSGGKAAKAGDSGSSSD